MTRTWHRAADRPRADAAGRTTYHSFSFGAHYDPDNLGYGGLLAHNDDRLDPGAGYPDHPHVDVEIVTWVVSGVLLHRDSSGGAADLGAGTLQVQSAGAGITHSEIADTSSGPTRFVQAWVRPDQPGGVPRRGLTPVGDALVGGALVPLVSGSSDALLGVRAVGATLSAARLGRGAQVRLPDDPLQHVFVVGGRVRLPDAGEALGDGDALRLTDEPGHLVVGEAPADVLVWSFRG